MSDTTSNRDRPVVSTLPLGEHVASDLRTLASEDVVAVGVPVYESDGAVTPLDGVDGPLLAKLLDTLDDREAGGRGSATRGGSLPGQELFSVQGFTGRRGQVIKVLSSSGKTALVYLGLGMREKVVLDDLRRAAGAFVRAAGGSGCAVLLLAAGLAESSGNSLRRAAQALAEGVILAAYRFSQLKSHEQTTFADQVVIGGVGTDPATLAEGAARGVRVARAVLAARDMVNEPPSSMTPGHFAEIASRLVESAPRTDFEVWDDERITAERLGGLLGVARGSAEPPRLVRVDYEPDPSTRDGGSVPHVVLVGKGITFDSGGLSLKSAEGMMTMKTDMSGAAAVIAAASACGDLGVAVRVTALAPLTENMPGGTAQKPGDVIRIRDGQTIEVLNTDAEGRLVLADGLSLAAELRPDAIVDLATLTGAAVVALGGSIAGLFGNDEALVERVRVAAGLAGEPLWRLPLPEDYRDHIDSEVADMKNIGKPGQAGAIAAALLLERFVDDVPWAHIDMAGPARSDEDAGVLTKGGTGFGVRTILELLDSFGVDSRA
jgi:leucyl aminopeptidase